MQLQIHIEDIIRHIKHPTQIGVQYNNPIVDALRRDLCVPADVSIEAYSNQATIHYKRGQITVSYHHLRGKDILQASDHHVHPFINANLIKNLEDLSLDLCPSSSIIYKNIITKARLKDYYKYCED